MPEVPPDEPTFYRPRALRLWFLAASVLLLVAVVAVIRDDAEGPLREWKVHQRDSLAREVVRIDSEIESLRRAGLPSAAAAIERLERRRRALSPAGLEGLVRENPFTDFTSPVLRVREEDLPKLREVEAFARVPRIDRCPTCHAGIDRPETLAGTRSPPPVPNPAKAHPRQDLYVGFRSPHPKSAFGCTICHDGNPQALTFDRAAHSPRDDAQRKAWSSARGWAPSRTWDLAR